MPVLGSGGRVLLKRPTPGTCELRVPDFRWECNSFVFNCPGWWNGDLVCVDQFPGYDENGIPYNPDGYASYAGSRWYLGPNRDQISDNSDKFYKDNTEDYPTGAFGDAANFYAVEGVGEVPEGNGEGCYYIHIDDFGNAKFYDSKCNAIAGCGEEIPIANTWFDGSLTVYPYGQSDYQNASWSCLYDQCALASGSYAISNIEDEATGISICESAPEFDFPVPGTSDYGDANVLPRPYREWPTPQALCNLREYTLTLDAPSIDTTLVGDKFGDAVKSLVNGGGSFEFFLDRQCLSDNQEDSSWMLMNLLFLTEGGCSGTPIETEAWFYLSEGEGCDTCFPPIGGALYYKASILITQTAINLRPSDLVVGTAQFVTTKEIKLLQGPS